MSHLSGYGVSHGIKEPLVLKARLLSGSQSALQVPEQALDEIPIGLGLV